MAIVKDRFPSPSLPRYRIVSEDARARVVRIRQLAERNVGEAREGFKRQFGYAVTDKRVDYKLQSALSTALVQGGLTREVRLPQEIALALYLREGGAGRAQGANGGTPSSCGD
jgi:hypothetical protein